MTRVFLLVPNQTIDKSSFFLAEYYFFHLSLITQDSNHKKEKLRDDTVTPNDDDLSSALTQIFKGWITLYIMGTLSSGCAYKTYCAIHCIDIKTEQGISSLSIGKSQASLVSLHVMMIN